MRNLYIFLFILFLSCEPSSPKSGMRTDAFPIATIQNVLPESMVMRENLLEERGTVGLDSTALVQLKMYKNGGNFAQFFPLGKMLSSDQSAYLLVLEEQPNYAQAKLLGFDPTGQLKEEKSVFLERPHGLLRVHAYRKADTLKIFENGILRQLYLLVDGLFQPQ